MISELLIVVGLLMIHGLFSGSEIAVLTVRKTRLREFIRRKDRRALALKGLRDHPERFLATVQIGMTIAGTAAAAFGGARLEGGLEPTYRRLGFDSWAPTVSLITVVADRRVHRARRRRARAEIARVALRRSLFVLRRAPVAHDVAHRSTDRVAVDRHVERISAVLRRSHHVHRGAAVARRAPATRRRGGEDRLGRSARLGDRIARARLRRGHRRRGDGAAQSRRRAAPHRAARGSPARAARRGPQPDAGLRQQHRQHHRLRRRARRARRWRGRKASSSSRTSCGPRTRSRKRPARSTSCARCSAGGRRWRS